MATKDEFSPEFLRELALGFPEVKQLLIDRRQIEQDAKAIHTYKKPSPHPRPKGDIHFSKTHIVKMNDTHAKREHTKTQLDDNAKNIKIAINDRLHKAGIGEVSKSYNEMTSKELVTFLEKGYDTMLKEREINQSQAIENSLKMSSNEHANFMDRCQSIRQDFLQNKSDKQLEIKSPDVSNNFE
jgi:hypothetical protein